MEKYLKVIVAGEVDVGKSSLIGRFLYEMGLAPGEALKQIESICLGLNRPFEYAYLLDSLEEERENQLTMETTQAFCKNRKGRDLVFIDVPGHGELLKNMLSGSSYGDKAVLVVDVEKSIEEGTKRHINVLRFLGVKNPVVVINKMDLVDFDKFYFEETKRKICDFLNEIGIEAQYFIPISARQGENLIRCSRKMTWYKGLSLLEALLAEECNSKKKMALDFYFPIQDVYDIDGERIYAGTVISGSLKKGDMIGSSLLERKFKVKAIRVLKQNKSTAGINESVGVILVGHSQLKRGDVIYKTKAPEVKNEITANIFCIKPLTINSSITFKCFTQETPARIKRINSIMDTTALVFRNESSHIYSTDFAEVVISVSRPVFIKKFNELNSLGRFVLKNEKEICAAGIVL